MKKDDYEVSELIDLLYSYTNSLKEQKDNAIENSGSFRSVGILYSLNNIGDTLNSLNHKLGNK